MVENQRTPEHVPDPQASQKQPAMKEPPQEKPAIHEPDWAQDEVDDEDRFQRSDN